MKATVVVLLTGILTAIAVVRNQVPRAEKEPKKSPVALSVEYPNVAAGGIPGHSTIHIRNDLGQNIKALPDFDQARATGQLKIAVRDTNGMYLKQIYPLLGGPPLAPKEKDYITLNPKESGRLGLDPGVIVQGYDLKPGRLYFFELTLKIGGLEEDVKLVTPFGYTEAPER